MRPLSLLERLGGKDKVKEKAKQKSFEMPLSDLENMRKIEQAQAADPSPKEKIIPAPPHVEQTVPASDRTYTQGQEEPNEFHHVRGRRVLAQVGGRQRRGY